MQYSCIYYICAMNLTKLSLSLDKIGILASSLCAIHCASLPLIATLLPLTGLNFLASEWIEQSMIAIALIVGFVSMWLSYIKTHNRPLPVLILSLGFLVIVAGHNSTDELESIFIPIGGVIIAYSHYVNWKYTLEYKNHPH